MQRCAAQGHLHRNWPVGGVARAGSQSYLAWRAHSSRFGTLVAVDLCCLQHKLLMATSVLDLHPLADNGSSAFAVHPPERPLPHSKDQTSV